MTMIDRSQAATGETMENPARYRGYNIRYVVNDVAPDTLTACIEPLEGGNPWTTSQRIFRTVEAWHNDIRGKIDADIEHRHPTCKSQAIPQLHVSMTEPLLPDL